MSSLRFSEFKAKVVLGRLRGGKMIPERLTSVGSVYLCRVMSVLAVLLLVTVGLAGAQSADVRTLPVEQGGMVSRQLTYHDTPGSVHWYTFLHRHSGRLQLELRTTQGDGQGDDYAELCLFGPEPQPSLTIMDSTCTRPRIRLASNRRPVEIDFHGEYGFTYWIRVANTSPIESESQPNYELHYGPAGEAPRVLPEREAKRLKYSDVITMNEGSKTSYTVRLTTKPLRDFEVKLDTSPRAEGVVLSHQTLTFTANNWDHPVPVTIYAPEDVDGDRTVTVGHVLRDYYLDTRISGIDKRTGRFAVQVIDDDPDEVNPPEVVVLAPDPFEINEGASSEYTVRLDGPPVAGTAVTVVVGYQGTDLSLSQTTLTFTENTWDIAQPVTVETRQDSDATDDVVTLLHLVDGRESEAIQVTVLDDDTVGVTVDPALELTVQEGGDENFTVVLDTQPAWNVEVAVGPASARTDVTVMPPSLTFTPGDWNLARTLTVNAHDTDPLPNMAVNLNFGVTSADSDYDGLKVDPLTVTIIEDHLPGVVLAPDPFEINEGASSEYTVRLDGPPVAGTAVTVVVGYQGTDLSLSQTTLTFTENTWDIAQPVTVETRQDSDATDDVVTLLHLVDGRESEAIQVTVLDDDTVGVTVDPALELTVQEGGDENFTVVLDTQPAWNVEVAVGPASARTDVTVMPPSLTFTPGDWNLARTLTVNAHDTDPLPNMAVNLNFGVTSADSDYDGLKVDPLTVTIIEDHLPGVVLAPDPFEINEGASSEYTVRLDGPPVAGTAVTVVVGYQGTDLSLSQTTLTFTENTWDIAQPVTVETRQDSDTTDDVVTLLHLVDGRESEAIQVTVLDDDTVGVTVDPALELTVQEGGDENFTVVLDTQPAWNVEVAVGPASARTDVTVMPPSLTFTPGDWNLARTLTVNAHDTDPLPNMAVNLNFGVTSADSDYDGLKVDPLTVTIIEDHLPGVVLAPDPFEINEGASSEYTVRLDGPPVAGTAVTVVVGYQGTDLSLSQTTLTFTENTWDIAQPVTVETRQDSDATDDVVTLLHLVDGRESEAIQVTVLDDDTVGVTVSRSMVSVEEGTSETYTVVLDTEPTGNVLVAMTADLARTDLTVDPMLLPFTTRNWNTAQTVTVSAAEDEDVARDRMVKLTYTVTSADTQYAGLPVDPIEVKIVEVDHVMEPEYRLVRRNLKRTVAGAVANVTKNIGSRFSAAGGGQTALTLAGQQVPVGGALTASRGADTAWRQSGLFADDGFEGRTRSLTGSDLLRATAFQMPLGATELQPIDFSNWTLWGRGDIALFDSEGSDDGQYDTDLKAGYLGVDKWLNQRWLGGVATSRIRVDSEYGLNSGGGGRLKFTMTSVHPYLRYSPDASNEWWVILGAGTGEIENKREVLLEPESSRVLLYMGATGLRRVLTTWADRAADLALVGDLGFGYLDGESEADDHAIGNLALETLRVRLGLSGSYTFEMAKQQTATSFIEVAGRFDGGEGDSDFGLEFSGGVVFAHIPSGLAVELRGNILGLYTDRFYREYGASATASMTSQAGGEGLSLAVTPRIGRQNQGADILWRDAPFALPEGSLDLPAMSLDARVGYGFSAPALMGGPRVLLTPFGEMRLKNEDERRLRAGVRFGGTGSAAGGSHVELFVDQDDGVGDVEHRVGLVGRWRF